MLHILHSIFRPLRRCSLALDRSDTPCLRRPRGAWRVLRVAAVALLQVTHAQPFLPGVAPEAETPAAQQPADDSEQSEAPAEGHESEAETIAKCLQDLETGDVQARRRAVMILGKYRNPLAMRGVMGALRDPDVEVRRSALVSASEWPALPPGGAEEILRLVRDDNVQVRRLASSMLPDLVGGQTVQITDNDGSVKVLRLPGAGGTQQPNKALLATALNAALRDEDNTVRRNALAVAPQVPELLERDALEACLRDDDREIRVLAVQAYARLQGEQGARAAALAPLARDPDPTVRREVARALGSLGMEGVAVLQAMLEDQDAGVRLDVVRELVQLQHPDGLKMLRRVVLDETLPAEERRDLVRYARLYRGEAEALLKALTESRSSMLRATALSSLARLPEYQNNAEFFLPFLEDSSPDVRGEAGQVLARVMAYSRRDPKKAAAFDADRLADWFDSQYSDVRELAVRLALYLPADERQDLLIDACLDDDVAVRCQALRSLALLGTPEARDIVIRSLQDPNDEVVIAAIQGLASRPDREALKALQAFYQDSDRPAVKEVAISAIARLQQMLTQGSQSRPQQPPTRPTQPPKRATQTPKQATPAPPRWPLPK